MKRWTKAHKAKGRKSAYLTADMALKGPPAVAGSKVAAFAPTAIWDPYWLWADLTKWSGFVRLAPWDLSKGVDPSISVLIRAVSFSDLQKLADSKIAKIARSYLDAKTRFATARVKRSRLAKLGAFPNIEFELGAPLKDQGADLAGDARGFHGQETQLNLPSAKDLLKRVQPVNSAATQSIGTIAVFDYGCPFLRNEYAQVDPGNGYAPTRLKAIWHQQEIEAAKPWKRNQAHAYGRQMSRPMLEGIRQRVFDARRGLDEVQAYSCLQYLIDYDDPRRRVFASTHGAHVLDVVGGRTDPLFPPHVAQPTADKASEADLIFVHMPESTAGDSSGASLGVYLLDALRFSLDMAAPKKPLVANVSYGSTAGPHDGSSMIEQAMDELLDGHKEFAVVLAAGNSRRLGLHTSRMVTKKRTALFRVNAATGDHTDTFIEFWYPTLYADRTKFRARLPDGDWSDWIECDNRVDLLSDTGDEVVATLIHRRQVPNGGRPVDKSLPERSMVLLALRPTEAPDDDDGELAPPGQWEVEVCLQGVEPDTEMRVDGWIRRDDSRPFSNRVQSVFMGLQVDDADNTLSNLSSGEHTVVAGAFRWSDGMAADYSSVGPRRKGQWPMVYGMSEWDSADPGIRAAAVRSRETFLMNGTSVAAPVVARRIFNLMCSQASPNRQTLLKDFKAAAELQGSLIRVD